jgi:hypothetical protein
MARGQAGSRPPEIEEVAAPITPCRHRAGPTVLNKRRQVRAHVSTAKLGGDAGGTNKITMPVELAVRAVEPAPGRLGHPPSAAWAGGGRASLVHEPHSDSHLHRRIL